MYTAVMIARRGNISRGKFMPTPKDIDLERLAQFQVDENNQLYCARGAPLRSALSLKHAMRAD